ncbi:MAG TPA: cobalamin biosynthesis protein [Nocardioides sp.]
MSRAAGLALGYAADRLLGDPSQHHPVAGFGRLAAALERRVYAASRTRGAAYALVLVGSTTLLGVALERSTRGRPLTHTLVTAAATWTVLGGRSLAREAEILHAQLAAGDLPAARIQLTHLVGRDTSDLDAAEIARAAVESLAENTSDAVVAPLVWGAVGGVPGLLGYRAANTLDAMVGHRSDRYERFGWASARLDDVLNLPGSRLSALLAAAFAPAAGGSPRDACAAWRRDAHRHPSPNAGPVEASFAGALGVRLGGTNVYGDGDSRRVEHRAEMGDGPAPAPADLDRARRLADLVGLAAAGTSVAVALLRRRRSGPARRAGRRAGRRRA